MLLEANAFIRIERKWILYLFGKHCFKKKNKNTGNTNHICLKLYWIQVNDIRITIRVYCIGQKCRTATITYNKDWYSYYSKEYETFLYHIIYDINNNNKLFVVRVINTINSYVKMQFHKKLFTRWSHLWSHIIRLIVRFLMHFNGFVHFVLKINLLCYKR